MSVITKQKKKQLAVSNEMNIQKEKNKKKIIKKKEISIIFVHAKHSEKTDIPKSSQANTYPHIKGV